MTPDKDELDQLLQAEVPPASETAQKQAMAAAMNAYQKNHQENQQSNRLTWTQHKIKNIGRILDMIFSSFTSKQAYWFSGISTCAFLFGAFILFKAPTPETIRTVEPTPTEESAIKQPEDASFDDALKSQQGLVMAETKKISPETVNAGNRVKNARAPTSQTQKMKPQITNMAATPPPPRLSIAQDRIIQPQKEYRDRFEKVDESAVKQVAQHPVSTFSIDVDTASYSFVRRMLNQGKRPSKNAIRIEEMINYFDYQYPKPTDTEQPFKSTITVLKSPWKAGNKLVHIAIQGYNISAEKQPDSNLVFLLDVSGSMNAPDKLPLVKQSMELLLSQLKPSDTVGIVVYAGAAGVVLEPTKVAEKTKILSALNRLQAGGSTTGGEGLALAYQLAENHFKKEAVNRILLATDGDFNVGHTEDTNLQTFVERKRAKGIYLSVLGFGQGNYQDALMQKLAQNGNGIATYIDTLGEAQKVLVDEATSALFPIAQDVKIQVEFNPSTVQEYRLIGYETRALKQEDFNNDRVDAGDIGAGHSVTAIYEITPTDSKAALTEPSRYRPDDQKTADKNADEYGFVKMRYKLPQAKTSKLISSVIPLKTKSNAVQMREVRFSSAVAGFAQLLKDSVYGDWEQFDYDKIIDMAQNNKGEDNYGYRTEFIQLVRKAKLAKAL